MRHRLDSMVRILAAWSVLAVATATVYAENVRVRLVQASHGPAPEQTEALRDVLPLLRRNLRFQSYQLLSDRRFTARTAKQVQLGRDFSLTVTSVSERTLGVSVASGQRRLLSTRAHLVPNKPLLLGGFPDRKGRTHIIILSLR